MNVSLGLFGFLLSMLVVIQHAHLTKDGMDMVALIFPVHQVPTTMALSAYVLVLNSNASHGNITMEYNVYISHSNVLLAPTGTKLLVFLKTMVVLLVLMERITIVSHSLKDVVR